MSTAEISRPNSVEQEQSMSNECFSLELRFILPCSRCRLLHCPLLHLSPPALPRHVELSTQKIQPWKARENCDWFSPESLLLPPPTHRTPSLSPHKLARNLINIVKLDNSKLGSTQQRMTLACCQDHILTENIWFAWSETSYSGDEKRCYRCGTNEQPNEQ